MDAADEPRTTEVAEGREANAVIVFADIVGCSQISDTLGLRDYASFIDEFHETAEKAAATVFPEHEFVAFRDFELSIRGDEACVIIHRSPREDVLRALVFAVTLQLLWLAADYNRKRLAKGALPVELGIGIHAGAVFIDTFQHAQPTSEGYSINVAKRIEGLTRGGETSKIMISSQAFARLAPEDRGLAFLTRPFEPIDVRGVGGKFVLREVFEFDETMVFELRLPAETFDQALLDQIRFVADTRVDALWLHVLWRTAYGIANGEEALFRHRFSEQTEASRNANSWFVRAQKERAAGDPNMAVMMFELSASSSSGQSSTHDSRDAKAWAFFNAAMTHEERQAFSASVRGYQQALCLRPGHSPYQLGLVCGYLKADRPQDALSFLRDIRDELLDDRESAAALFLESVCHEQLSDAKSAAACRVMLLSTFDLVEQSLPARGVFLRPGVNSGNAVLDAFQNVKRRTAR